MLIALGFMIVLMIFNLRGVSESVKVNVLLTLIELSGLLLVIGASIYFITGGEADFSRAVAFETANDKNDRRHARRGHDGAEETASHCPEDSCPAHRGAWSGRVVVFDGA